VGAVKVSRNHALLAYTLPHHQGADAHCAVVRAAAGGPLLAVLPSAMGVEWLADGCGLVFTVPDEQGRPWQVGRAEGLGFIPPETLLLLRCCCWWCRCWCCPSCLPAPAALPLTSSGGLRPPAAQVYRQQIAAPGAAGRQGEQRPAPLPELLLEERDATRHLQLGRTKDWRWVTINSNSKLSCEVGGRAVLSGKAGKGP
jgi:hypothetical protein